MAEQGVTLLWILSWFAKQHACNHCRASRFRTFFLGDDSLTFCVFPVLQLISRAGIVRSQRCVLMSSVQQSARQAPVSLEWEIELMNNIAPHG